MDLQKRTAFFIKDLHAREAMRLRWYRHWEANENKLQYLRERKARHEAFLKDLLRKRGLSPAWYARVFYLAGHIFGWMTAFLPEKLALKIEKTLEFWMLYRYKRYLKKLTLDFNLRTMIESIQLKRFAHNEPDSDVLNLLEKIISEEQSSASSSS